MIHILTTSYNGEPYIERCLGSIMSQKNKDFKCYITDDISTDKSVDRIKDFIKGDDRFILIENTTKMYQPGNYDQVIRGKYGIDDNDIMVEVDGDDWFPDRNVLTRVESVYSDSEVWVANGKFQYSDGRPGFASPPKNIDNIRNETFTASHLRTWRAFLWRKIKVDDLKDKNGVYWEVAGDLSFMYPMIEMAGIKHYKFMDDINYIYNESNPLNDHKVKLNSVGKVVNIIRNMPKYNLL